MSAEEAIAWALETLRPGDLRFAVSFQKTSSVIVDIAHRIEPGARFFYVDTGLLFPETYATRDALAERYGIEFERFAGHLARQAGAEHGADLWRRRPGRLLRRPQGRADANGPRRRRLLGLGDSQGRLARLAPAPRGSAGTSASVSGS